MLYNDPKSTGLAFGFGDIERPGPEVLWDIDPYFDANLSYVGCCMRSKLDGRYIRANPAMLDGGGVTLVHESELDLWAGWELRYAGWNDYQAVIRAYQTNYAPQGIDLTVAGTTVKSGTQVITYHWKSERNQIGRAHV